MNIEKPNFVIIDANAFVHSSFHGYSEKLDAKNQDQKVLYGIINTLNDLTYQLPKIDLLCMVFDPSDGSLYRKSKFPAYKENRPPTNPDLLRQKLEAKKVIEDHLGIITVNHQGYEADDIIGSLMKYAKNEYRVIIVSPDKDLVQLIEDDVVLLRKYKTKTEKGYKALNIHNSFQEFGVYPHQIPDWLAIVGDTADNLPGLYKEGKKSASEILANYKSIEHLLSYIHELDNENLKNKILNNKEQLLLVKDLATIVCDLKIEDKFIDAYEKAKSIRTKENYSQKLQTISKHYNWPHHFIELFK